MISAAALAVVFAFVQLSSVRLTNPPSMGELSAPFEVSEILRRSCYDCHSNQTRWPWYSRVAPFSWIVVHHVELGRKEVNFSEWGDYYPRTRQRKLQWMQRALQQQVMPPWSYTLMHRGTRLSADDRARLQRWIEIELTENTSGQSK